MSVILYLGRRFGISSSRRTDCVFILSKFIQFVHWKVVDRRVIRKFRVFLPCLTMCEMCITHPVWGLMYPKEYKNLRFRIADFGLSYGAQEWYFLCLFSSKTVDYPIILYDLETFRINSSIGHISRWPFQRTYSGGLRKFTKDMKDVLCSVDRASRYSLCK